MFACKRLVEPNVVNQAQLLKAMNSGALYAIVSFGTSLSLYRVAEEPAGCALLEKQDELEVGSTVVLITGGCKNSSFLILTDDAEVILLQVAEVGGAEGSARMEVLHRQFLPIDVVALTPPPADVPAAHTNADGTAVALFALKGFVHVVLIDRILSRNWDHCCIVVHQLDKANLASIILVDGSPELVVLPLYEGQLATLKGFYVSRYAQMQRLVDPALSDNVGGLPISVIMLCKAQSGSVICAITKDALTPSRRRAVCFRPVGPKEPYTVTLPDHFALKDAMAWVQVSNDSVVWVVNESGRLCVLDLRREECRDECSAAVEAVEVLWPDQPAHHCWDRRKKLWQNINFLSLRSCASTSESRPLVLVGASSSLFVVRVEGNLKSATVIASLLSDGPLTSIASCPDNRFFLSSRDNIVSAARVVFSSPRVATAEGFSGVNAVFLMQVETGLQWRVFVVVSCAYATRALYISPTLLIELDHSGAGHGELSDEAYVDTWNTIDNESTLECKATSGLGGCAVEGAQRAFIQVTATRVRLGVRSAVKGYATYRDFELPAYTYTAAAAEADCAFSVGVSGLSIEALEWTSATHPPKSSWYKTDSEITAVQLCNPTAKSQTRTIALGMWEGACVRFVSFAEGLFTTLSSVTLDAIPTSMVLSDVAPVLVAADANGRLWSLQFGDPEHIILSPCEIPTPQDDDVDQALPGCVHKTLETSKHAMPLLCRCTGSSSPTVFAVTGAEIAVMRCCSMSGKLLRKHYIDAGDVEVCTAVAGISLQSGNATGLLVVADGAALHFQTHGTVQTHSVRQMRRAVLVQGEFIDACSPPEDDDAWTEEITVSHIFAVDRCLLAALKTTRSAAQSIGGLRSSSTTSSLVVCDSHQFLIHDAILLEPFEVVTAFEAVGGPHGAAGLVAVATGILPSTGDHTQEPTCGRVLIVGVSPLRLVGKVKLDRAVYDLASFVLPSSSTDDSIFRASGELDGDGDVLLAAANADQVLLVRVIGQEVQVMCRAPTTMRCTVVTVTTPHVVVADYDGGDEIFEVLPPTAFAGNECPEGPGGSAAYRLVRRGGHVMHGSGVIAQKPFFNGEMLRVDTFRNVTVHALEVSGGSSDEAGSSPPLPSEKSRDLTITGSMRLGSAPTSLTIVNSIAPLEMLFPPFVGFNKHFDSLFRVTAISPRGLITCSDGSLFLVTTIPLELGRLLLRLQTAMDKRGHHPPSLQTFREKTTTRYVNSSLCSQNFLCLNYLERFLTLPLEQQEEIARLDVQPENADTVSELSLCQLLSLIGMVL
jgi:hypothetical protein